MKQTETVNQFLDFLALSPTPYHAVQWLSDVLKAHGFREVSETSAWDSDVQGKCFVVRGGKSIIAWVSGTDPVSDAGFRIVGAHTDSPGLKPRSAKIDTIFGLPMLETSIYGSPIYQTWLDRDLGLAGAVYTSTGPEAQLFKSDQIKLRTSSLAIHLDKSSRDGGLKVNPHSELNCLITMGKNAADSDLDDLIANELGLPKDAIIGSDLYLYDAQGPSLLVGDPGFISAGCLDNLFSCYSAILSLVNQDQTLASTSVVALFDAEEIGSRSWIGAQGTFLSETLERLASHDDKGASGPRSQYRQAIANSYLVSVDMAHANHPLYKDKLHVEGAPNLNGGVAIKQSNRGHYAMSTRLEALLRSGAKSKNVPVQNFMYREDLGGGTSIGPLVSAQLGIETIDVGVGLLGMHSLREIAGAQDLKNCIDFLDVAFAI